MGTSSSGNEPVSAVFGRPKGGLSMITLKVPGSVLCEFMVCSSTVEKDRERTWVMGRGGETEWVGTCFGSSPLAFRCSGRAFSARVGVREPYRLCSQSLLDERCGLGSSVALSGGVCGGKTKGSGTGRFRWFAARTTGLQMAPSVYCIACCCFASLLLARFVTAQTCQPPTHSAALLCDIAALSPPQHVTSHQAHKREGAERTVDR
jgi:hypothetical protein